MAKKKEAPMREPEIMAADELPNDTESVVIQREGYTLEVMPDSLAAFEEVPVSEPEPEPVPVKVPEWHWRDWHFTGIADRVELPKPLLHHGLVELEWRKPKRLWCSDDEVEYWQGRRHDGHGWHIHIGEPIDAPPPEGWHGHNPAT